MKAVFKKIIDLLKEKQQLHNANAQELKSKNRIGLTAIAEASVFGFYEAIEIVKQVAKGYKNGWIPASSGNLPETRKIYLNELDIFCNVSDFVWVTLQSGNVVQANIEEGKWYLASGNMLYEEVIAWQPFIEPEPYLANQSTWQQQIMRRFEKVE